MAASFFQTTRPEDIVFLIETRLQLYQYRYLLAVFRSTRQRSNDRTVAAHTVQRLLNRQHLRVIGSIAHQLNYRVKAFIGVMQQNIIFTDSGEQIAVIRQLQRTLRHKGLIQPRPHALHTDKFKEAGRVQRSVDFINLHLRNIQIFLEEFFDTIIIRFEDFQANRSAALTLTQRFLNLLHKVNAVILFQVKVTVTRYSEGHHIQNVAALEQIVAMAGDNILQKYEGTLALRLNLHNAVQYARHLNQAHAVLAVSLNKLNSKVQCFIGQKREGSRSIYRHRCQYRENNLAVIFLQPVLAQLAQILNAAEMQLHRIHFCHQRNQRFCLSAHLLMRCLRNSHQLLMHRHSGGIALFYAAVKIAPQTGYAHHKEFI